MLYEVITAAERTALLTFLVVGAGPTGVELAGAIAELARFGMAKEFRTLGCYPLTAAEESDAGTLEQVIEEVFDTRQSERHGRIIDLPELEERGEFIQKPFRPVVLLRRRNNFV